MEGVKRIVVLDYLALGAGGPFTGADAIYQLLVFALLMFLLKKFAWGPLVGVMKQREDYVNNEIEEAEADRAEAQKLLEEQRQQLNEARTEASELIANAKKQSEQMRVELTEAAKVEAERMKEAARREIAQERDAAVAALREQVASLSVLVASKVISKELTSADQDKLIQDTIKEAGDIR
ncbi:F0F1 ATP synthase subunit B [Mangrovibacillus cuniculi]|uniref:F0F1 ATP synthase subunit B n=1 Tax=Mangrovibacillus cuniculi TaxID=2593652 RepID=UPI001EFA18EC|nr:F0F1 ATP synthase subunit B [Mangrovibacillus cuniculi]